MGFTPQDVRQMSLWDLGQSWAGFKRANRVEEKSRAPSEDEFDAAVAEAFDG